MSFGSVIRNRRTALGISLNDLAERLKISPAYWSRIERDQENPPRDELIERAAAILGVQMDELFVEAQRLPPDMREDMGRVVLAYRRLRFMGKR
ncbi:MAG: helix-turn-helix domain-containing protein [Alphaproteobacteria bacterium]|jgi:HTH-type transcriptional regulator, competence development regulator|uniref:helix-turn-helix domain-containing protein n=1 Tax=Novosphingobium sp. Chol11 TaxID=1385763 RepID=UPI0022C699C8|nr:helix-turn-helix transcriptional regulator [Novosphingobium sp. Chol11]MCA3371778.1 helix-turn-helix transcriptional regulator [Roseomonas sp.]MCZ8280566.1 helix-turn-helix transcriptional regulator [Acetobacteraceae bacterium]